MSTKKLRLNQNAADLALSHYGTIEGLIPILQDNNASLPLQKPFAAAGEPISLRDNLATERFAKPALAKRLADEQFVPAQGDNACSFGIGCMVIQGSPVFIVQ